MSGREKIFVSAANQPITFYVPESIEDGREILDQIFVGGGEVTNELDDADIILVGTEQEARLYLEGQFRVKIVLDVSWVEKCMGKGQLLGAGQRWGGCRFAPQKSKSRDRKSGVSFQAAESDEEEGHHVKSSLRSNPPLSSHNQPGPSEPAQHSAYASGSDPTVQRKGQPSVTHNLPSFNQPQQPAMAPQMPGPMNVPPQGPFAYPFGFSQAQGMTGTTNFSANQGRAMHPSGFFREMASTTNFPTSQGPALHPSGFSQVPSLYPQGGFPTPNYIPQTGFGPQFSSNHPFMNQQAGFAPGLAPTPYGQLINYAPTHPSWLLESYTAVLNLGIQIGRGDDYFGDARMLNLNPQNVQNLPAGPQGAHHMHQQTDGPSARDFTSRNTRANISPTSDVEAGPSPRQTGMAHSPRGHPEASGFGGLRSSIGPIRTSRGGKKAETHSEDDETETDVQVQLDISRKPPTPVSYKSGIANAFTPKDQEYLTAQLKYVLDHRKKVPRKAFFDAIALGGRLGHPSDSWRSWLAKDPERRRAILDKAGATENDEMFIREKRGGSKKGKERAR